MYFHIYYGDLTEEGKKKYIKFAEMAGASTDLSDGDEIAFAELCEEDWDTNHTSD